VRDANPVALDALEERPGDTVSVDEDAMPACPVRHEVRVREPGGMLRPLEDHRATVSGGSRR
jgi:hypothetical protein